MSWYVDVKPYGNSAVLLTGVKAAVIKRLEKLSSDEFTVRGGLDSVLISSTGPKTVIEIVSLLENQVAITEDSNSTLPSTHEIQVQWNGEDLEEVAGLLGCSTAKVIQDLESSSFEVLLIGFAPGFPYLKPSEESPVSKWKTIPRLAVPRRSVPAGAIGVAADMACIYPAALPGGWNILGQTNAVLFDAEANPPALMMRGDIVRFVSAGGGDN